jgi:methyl-accepting chemotaxis protein
VVADEVRPLAQRTQTSTEEIQNIIASLVRGVSEAVTAMQDSRVHAQNAVEKAATAGDSLGTIAQSADNIMDMNTQIAAAIEEESKVTDEMDRNIVNVSRIAGETAEAAERNELVGVNR